MKGPPVPAVKYENLNDALASAALSESGLTFVDRDEQDRFFPWKEVRARATQVAGALVALGIGPGDRVAIVLPTVPEFVDCFLGAVLAGAVPVPLYPPVRLGRLGEYHRSTARMLEIVGARIVVTDVRIRLLLGQVIERARPALGVWTADALLAQPHPPVERPVTAESLGLIQFSSGSTVDPKPVALTHRNLITQCAVLKALMPETQHPPFGVSWLPLYHDMGLIGALLQGIYYPGPLALISPEIFLARPAIWLRTLSRFRGTISPAPNFAYALCLKRISDADLAGVDLSAWTYALNGAEPVSVELMRRFAERFAPWGFRAESLMPVYGLSEASLAVTFTPRRSPMKARLVDPARLAGRGEVADGGRALPSVGTPVPGVELEVRDEEGHPRADQRVGRIFLRGPCVMRGYFHDDAATARSLQDGWLDTGDLGFIADGELFICGRAKDVVIIRGANHSPQEFEETLEGIEGLRAGCAVALGFIPADGEAECLLMIAECTVEPSESLVETVRAAVVERTGIRPHTVKLVGPGVLPRTSSGKMRRAEALRQFLSGELRPPSTVNAVRMAGQVARSALAYAKAKLTSDAS